MTLKNRFSKKLDVYKIWDDKNLFRPEVSIIQVEKATSGDDREFFKAHILENINDRYPHFQKTFLFSFDIKCGLRSLIEADLNAMWKLAISLKQ